VKQEVYVCDSCGKEREMGPAIIGWLDVAEVVLATVKDLRRWQLCSPVCVAVFAGTFKPSELPAELLRDIETLSEATAEVPTIGQYL
jgi:hypothetical protein